MWFLHSSNVFVWLLLIQEKREGYLGWGWDCVIMPGYKYKYKYWYEYKLQIQIREEIEGYWGWGWDCVIMTGFVVVAAVVDTKERK